MRFLKNRIGLLARLALLAATLIWGTTFVIMENTLETIPVFFILAFRFTVGSVLLFAVSYRKLKTLDKKYILFGASMGVFLFASYSFQTLGLTDPATTPGKNAFLTAVYCIIVPFLSWIVVKKRPDRFNILAAVLCLTGIGLVTLDSALRICTGDILTMVGGFFFAVHIIVTSRALEGRDPVLLTALQFASAALLSWIVSISTKQFPQNIGSSALVSMVYLSLMATTVCYLFQTFGQKYTPPETVAILMSLEAVFGIVFSLIMQAEGITLRLAFGFALIFVAIIISETKLSFIKKNRNT